jgi:diguanylate cyclase (GGDEF)-like protein/PAS domain S-box-containing protein
VDTNPAAETWRARQPAVLPPTPSMRRRLVLTALCFALSTLVLVAVAYAARRLEGVLPLVAIAGLLLAAAVWTALSIVKLLRHEAAALAENERRYRRLFEGSLAGIYRTSPDGRFFECNPALARLLGYGSAEELMQAGAATLYFDPSERERLLARLHTAGRLNSLEVRLRRKDGGAVWILENVTWRPAQDGEPDLIEGTLIDITDRKAAESQIAHLAYHDGLTDLPNRALFLDRLAQSLAKARRLDTGMAVLMLDLDRFKVISDRLELSGADQVLRSVADRIRAMVRGGDTLARYAGDQFALLLQYDARADDAAKVAQKLIERLAEPFELDGQRLHLTTSVGIGLFPADGGDAGSLLRSADLALQRAKELGGNGYQLCTAAMNARAVARLALEGDLRRALERRELELLYQPVVSLASGLTVGMEALVRWRHPDRGLVTPAQFIPLAEELRLVIPIGEWVLATACRQVKAWHAGPLPGIRIAVNLSALHFQDSRLPRTVAATLREVGLDPGYLDLEITESAAMLNIEQTAVTLAALRRLGVRISMDDFGTGQASLGYLKRLSIDCLKIDRDFVGDIDSGEAGQAIVTAIVDLAHGLGLTVIAEGVETEEQLRFLSSRGCDEYQGYLASKPMPAAAFGEQTDRSGLLRKQL